MMSLAREWPPGLRWQFDAAVALVGAEESARMDREAAAKGKFATLPEDRPRMLNLGGKEGGLPLGPDDYVSRTEGEIDASVDAFMATPMGRLG